MPPSVLVAPGGILLGFYRCLKTLAGSPALDGFTSSAVNRLGAAPALPPAGVFRVGMLPAGCRSRNRRGKGLTLLIFVFLRGPLLATVQNMGNVDAVAADLKNENERRAGND